jgi:hypothetical protein
MGTSNRQRWWIVANALAWLVTNTLGAIAYLWLASKTWIEPQLRGEVVGRAGDALVWGTTALPVALIFLLANLGMVGLSIFTGLRAKNWSLLFVAFAIGLGWALVMAIDLRNRF